MGRKKKKNLPEQPSPLATGSGSGAKGGNPDKEVVGTNNDNFISARKIANKKRRRNDHNQFLDAKNLIEGGFAKPPIRSSWFTEVKWVSHGEGLHRPLQNAQAKSSASSMRNDTNNLQKETAIESSSSFSSTGSITLPKNAKAHSKLLSELNDLKEQLMPTSKLCADAINETHNAKKSTTPEYEFRQARSICNPYERLGETFSKNHFSHRNTNKKYRKRKKHLQHTTTASSGLSQFVNRSAIKLANIDALLGFCLKKATPNSQECSKMDNGAQPPYIFVDLCGAPGGFSEYILYRHVHPASLWENDQGIQNSVGKETFECQKDDMQPCYGFGMSLSGSNADGKGVCWDLDHLKQYHLHPNDTAGHKNKNVKQQLLYYVCKGADGTGSIYNWKNVLQLQNEISSILSGCRDIACNNDASLAHLVVADGGFDAQRDSNNQEAIAHKIIVSQAAAALTLLRPGGIFVLKMFGFREDGTRRMLHYLYKSFDKITFVKPILSRPASAERYLVCHGYTGPRTGWDGFLWREQLMTQCATKGKETDEREYAPLEELMDSFDSDMLQLNIDTCDAIITYLRNKSEEHDNGHPGEWKREHCVDLREYEAAWQLSSQSHSPGNNNKDQNSIDER
mmetsp:Transcript_31173/g.65969  ORF Transcript_31173/g.65969 Transcript_31173/m.65969 type:complete len:624 (+) Transcript_31173:91-1962(+)